jgi:prepilin peptidase CpaA
MPTEFVLLLMTGLLFTGALASYHDWRAHRIPNAVVLGGLIYALAVFAALVVDSGMAAMPTVLRHGLLGLLVAALVMFVPYRLRQVGAGDVKLMMMFGFYLGPVGGMLALLNGALIGGIWALWISWRRQGLAKAWANMKLMGRTAWVSGFQELGWDLKSAGAVTMPYGVALSAGAALVAVWQLWLRLAA